MDLSGKTVLVTGASRGIGFAIARQMADAGAAVAAHYYMNGDRIADLSKETSGRIEPFQADLAVTSECRCLFNEVVELMGRVDVLVNNAGVAVYAPLSASTEEWEKAWNLTLGVNLRAAELLCRLAIVHFREHGGGRIVNVASRAAFRGDVPEYMTYAASKGGLVALTRSIARGCGADGIRAFVVAPGFVRTDMAQDFIDEFGEAHAMRDLATERLTEPNDVAPTVVFLASGLADHATGCTIDINAASYVH